MIIEELVKGVEPIPDYLFREVLGQITRLRREKKADYRDAHLLLAGIPGILYELESKVIRINQLENSKTKPKCESVEQSYLDLALYCILAICFHRIIDNE